MNFHEIRLPDDIERGAVGGPEFKTDIVELESGYEKRNIKWSSPRGSWNIGYGIQNIENGIDEVRNFFYARRGKAYGFRFKDWSDYEAVDEILDQDGSNSVQLRKQYISGSDTFNRKIAKPVDGTVSLERNSSPFSAYTLDTTTGIVSLNPDSSFTIADASQTNPVVITTDSPHDFSTGDEIYIRAVNGMTEINDRVFTVTVLTTTTFELDGEDGTNYGAYTNNGVAEKYVQSTENLTWSGEFDVPVRFDTDRLDIDVEVFNVGSAQSITIKELRV